MWWLRRSISTTSASVRFKARAAARPANPPPTITMRFRCTPGERAAGKVLLSRCREASAGRGRRSCKASLIGHLWSGWRTERSTASPARTESFVDSERSEQLHGWAFDQAPYRSIALTLFPKRLSP